MTQDQVRLIAHDFSGVEAIRAETRHSFARHSHETFGIGLMYRGAQKSASGRGMVQAGAGNIITVNPREIHDGHPIGDQPRGWNMLYFDPVLIANAAADLTDNQSTRYEFDRPVIANDTVARCFAALFAAVTQGNAKTAGLRRSEMLLLLLHHAVLAPAADGGPVAFGHIRHAKSLIDDDPACDISLADLAQACGLSRFQTLRHFTRATGLTPHAYVIQRRIDLARCQIKTGAPLADIAIACGFADQSHMNRHFVRAFGITPGRYARALHPG
ncbi:AraC family transcriptional regulator [Thalassospira sp.]|uniref:AraC family transcriptional regulator n=1 Tax=Thalassospira sp. TaxID=1912094 RepID=UPI00273504F2|nr:AraC family transcriptional regulator [Thalassospira sp.]MDP2698758.1 AraC family transcriptional regulator [Thalassospira sp.]